MRSVALLALATAAAAQYRGFNYGSTNNDGSVRQQADFEAEFNRAKSLQGASGFTSARLYTMIQGGTANGLSSAIPAAISTETSLLLGLWASQDQGGFDNELSALSTAIQQYGSQLTNLIAGISVGSEDLYRITPTGIENHSGIGQSSDTLVSYINQVRNVIKGTAISGASIGHVDTWTAWVNGSNVAVVDAVDWLGMDGYPYFQTTEANGISVGSELFFDSYNATVGVAQGKEVWITETGWPVQGPTANQAVASTQNAEIYWQQVACRVLGNINTWWYTLYDPAATSSDISFGLVGPNLDSSPLYDLSCGSSSTSSSSSTASPIPSSTSVPATNPPATEPAPQPTTTVVTSTPSVAPTTPVSQPPAQSSSPASPPAGSCPTNLNGDYQYPHLIVPIDSANPNTAAGTSYDGTVSPTISSIFNFDIPASYAGKTCSLVFLFPEQKDLQSSSFTFNNQGGFSVSSLSTPATSGTTYNNVPAANGASVSVPSVAPGNSYVVSTNACAAGQTIGYEFASAGGLDLTYFQDYAPSPIGAYVTVC